MLRDGQPLRIAWANPTTLLVSVTKLAVPYVFPTIDPRDIATQLDPPAFTRGVYDIG